MQAGSGEKVGLWGREAGLGGGGTRGVGGGVGLCRAAEAQHSSPGAGLARELEPQKRRLHFLDKEMEAQRKAVNCSFE